MPEDEKKDGAPEVQPAEVDAFGSSNTPPEAPKSEEKPDDKSGKDGKDDIESHPVVVALKDEIKRVKDEMGGNLSGQRTVIEKLEKELTDIRNGKTTTKDGEADVLYKDIKWSKDLSDAEKDEMTATEIKQMDAIASMQEAQNKMYAEMQTGKKDKAKEAEDKVTNLNELVRTTALELAGNDTAMANQIIEAVKQFNLTDLPADKVKERVLNATKLVSDYKPPKEQTKKPTKPVTGGGGKDTDPFGIDKIVEEATTGNKDGNYSL